MASLHVIFNEVNLSKHRVHSEQHRQPRVSFATPSLFRSISFSLSCSLQPFAIPFLAVPSHQLGRNLFRLQLSLRVLPPILIPSISHYPANSSPTWPSEKSGCSIAQPDASRSMRSSRLFHISFESAASYFPRIGVYIIFYCLLDSACRFSYYN